MDLNLSTHVTKIPLNLERVREQASPQTPGPRYVGFREKSYHQKFAHLQTFCDDIFHSPHVAERSIRGDARKVWAQWG